MVIFILAHCSPFRPAFHSPLQWGVLAEEIWPMEPSLIKIRIRTSGVGWDENSTRCVPAEYEGRRKRHRKKADAKTNNNVNQNENNQNANSAPPLTPADTATRPATAATPSTKSPAAPRVACRLSTHPPIDQAKALHQRKTLGGFFTTTMGNWIRKLLTCYKMKKIMHLFHVNLIDVFECPTPPK